MSKGPYKNFANRLIQTLKERGYSASRSPNGICMTTLARFTDASEQICRRYIRGDALPNYEKIKKLADHLQINPGWLLFGEEGHTAPKKNEFDEALLHYILKQSHHLYPTTEESNNEYADFVIGLLKDIQTIDTSENNLIKIIDLALSSLSYKEKRKKPSHAI